MHIIYIMPYVKALIECDIKILLIICIIFLSCLEIGQIWLQALNVSAISKTENFKL